MTAAQEKIIKESLEILLEGDSNFHLRIQKLANLKKKDSKTYNMALKLLDSMNP